MKEVGGLGMSISRNGIFRDHLHCRRRQAHSAEEPTSGAGTQLSGSGIGQGRLGCTIPKQVVHWEWVFCMGKKLTATTSAPMQTAAIYNNICLLESICILERE